MTGAMFQLVNKVPFEFPSFSSGLNHQLSLPSILFSFPFLLVLLGILSPFLQNWHDELLLFSHDFPEVEHFLIYLLAKKSIFHVTATYYQNYQPARPGGLSPWIVCSVHPLRFSTYPVRAPICGLQVYTLGL